MRYKTIVIIFKYKKYISLVPQTLIPLEIARNILFSVYTIGWGTNKIQTSGIFMNFKLFYQDLEQTFGNLSITKEKVHVINKGVFNFYQDIVKTLPNLIKLISEEDEEARLVIDYFIHHDKDASPNFENIGILALIKEVNRKLNQISNQVEELRSKEKNINPLLKENRNKLQAVMGSIILIKSLGAQIKTLFLKSINLNEHAHDYSKEFSLKANEIKFIFSDTEDKVNEILTKSEIVNQEYNFFHNILEKIDQYLSTHIKEVEMDMETIFNTLKLSLNELALILRDMVDRMETIKGNIYKVMKLTQNQDIIQQGLNYSVELAELSSQELTNLIEQSESNSEDKINLLALYLGFINNFLTLSVDSIDQARSLMVHTDDSLIEEFNNILKPMKSLNEDKEIITQFFISEKEGELKYNALDKIFEDSYKLVNKFLSSIQESVFRKQEIKDFGHHFEKIVQELHDIFIILQEIYDNFMKIESLSEKEVNRKDHQLERERSVFQNFKTICRKTLSTIESTLTNFLDIKETITYSISELQQSSNRLNREFSDIENDLSNMQSELDVSKLIIKETIFDFNKYSINLENIVKNYLDKFEGISCRNNECQDVYDTIYGIKNRIEQIQHDFYQEMVISHPDINQNQLKFKSSLMENNPFYENNKKTVRSRDEDIDDDFVVF